MIVQVQIYLKKKEKSRTPYFRRRMLLKMLRSLDEKENDEQTHADLYFNDGNLGLTFAHTTGY
jgi:hypothetical protein